MLPAQATSQTADPPPPRPGWRQVTKEEFYAAIGHLDVNPSILPGPYPYTSEFKMRHSRAVVGIKVGYRPEGRALPVSAYYLPAANACHAQ